MSRYARLFSSVDSTPIESKRFLIVPSLSSAARIPLPSATSALAVSCSSLAAISSSVVASGGSIPFPQRVRSGLFPADGGGTRIPDEGRRCGGLPLFAFAQVARRFDVLGAPQRALLRLFVTMS